MTAVNENELTAFLANAFAHGWPTATTPSTTPELIGFYESSYAEGEWSYFDLWSGATTDAGLQFVRHLGRPVWACAYRGGLLLAAHLSDATLTGNPVFAFLVQALSEGPEGPIALRGPARHTSPDGAWTYTFSTRGSLAAFDAFERIFEGDTLVYERTFIGGMIGDDTLYGAALGTDPR